MQAGFIILIFWILINGGAFLWVLTRWLPDGRFLQRNTKLKAVGDGHVYGALATLAVTGGYFAIGVLTLLNEEVAGQYAPVTLLVGSLVNLIPIYFYSRQLATDAVVAQHSSRWPAFQSGLAAVLMTAVVVWAFFNTEQAIDRLPPPFEYSSSEMPLVDSVLCPGDPISPVISGRYDGLARTAFVTGEIYRKGNSTSDRYFFPTLESSSVAHPELAWVDLEFELTGEDMGRYVPDLAPGEYTYLHGSYEFGSLTASFEAHFTVPGGCE